MNTQHDKTQRFPQLLSAKSTAVLAIGALRGHIIHFLPVQAKAYAILKIKCASPRRSHAHELAKG